MPYDFDLCLTPELVDEQPHKNCVIKFARKVLEEHGNSNEIALVAEKPPHVKSTDIYYFF